MKNLTVIFLICFSLIITGCPSKADLETYQKRSTQFATATNEAVNLTRKLYQEQIISLTQKDRIADGFINLATGGEAVDKAIKEALEAGGNVPKDKIEIIKKLFRSNIIDRFLDVLDRLKILNLSAEYRAMISTLKTTVLLLADVLTVRNSTEKLLEGV